ncbi:MAG TPA: phosphatase PAP2 family protein [Rhodoblastus sp.]|nr:phosphatase PAP2 family protein [Rhodoblastus sp.]
MGAAGFAAAAALVVTAVWPAVDLALARAALVPASSAARPALLALREVFRGMPYLLLCGTAIVLAVQTLRERLPANVAWRRLTFVSLTLALGPGLMVNAGLKAYSHRPRPVQTMEAGGGDMSFRPFFRFDGACRSNCSFSSGEAAGAFWTTGPALLAPPAYRLAATAAALGLGAIVSATRMALGAHFLSDVAFSALFVLALTLFMRRLMRPT